MKTPDGYTPIGYITGARTARLHRAGIKTILSDQRRYGVGDQIKRRAFVRTEDLPAARRVLAEARNNPAQSITPNRWVQSKRTKVITDSRGNIKDVSIER